MEIGALDLALGDVAGPRAHGRAAWTGSSTDVTRRRARAASGSRVERITLLGGPDGITTTTVIPNAEVEALIADAVEAQTGARPTSVTLRAPDRVSFTPRRRPGWPGASRSTADGDLVVRGDDGLTQGREVVLVRGGDDLPIELTSVKVTPSGGLRLTGDLADRDPGLTREPRGAHRVDSRACRNPSSAIPRCPSAAGRARPRAGAGRRPRRPSRSAARSAQADVAFDAAPSARQAPRRRSGRTTRRPTWAWSSGPSTSPSRPTGMQVRASGEPYVTHPIAVGPDPRRAGHRPGRRRRRAPPRRPRGHGVQPRRRRGAVRPRDRAPGGRRHQAVQVQHPQPRAAAGREHPEDVPGDGRRHPRRADQARRPAPQHAHAVATSSPRSSSASPARRWRSTRRWRSASGSGRSSGSSRTSRSRCWSRRRSGSWPSCSTRGAQGREGYIERAIEELRPRLEAAGIVGELQGRPKHIYSIWKKMQRKGAEFGEIYDVYAIRLLVDEIRDCYAALGIVHALWRPIPGQFDDYIAVPKNNLYQSLHTAVIALDGKPLEIQIRTHAMHQVSRGRHRGALALQGGLQGGARLRRQARLAAPAHGVAARRQRVGRDGVRRGHQARHLPGPGLRVHARAATSRTCPRAPRRSTSPTGSTPTSAIARSAPRSTTAWCRSTTGSRTATSSRS